MSRIFFVLSILLLFASCKNTKEEGIYKQGRIDYRISYLNAKEANYEPAYLPKRMTLKFNQEYSINQIDGFMGLFKLGNITYFKNKKVKTHLKVLDQNYTYNGGRNEMMCCFDCMDGMILTEDTSSYTFAGLKSKRLIVSFKDGREPFSIYYTSDIDLPHPNSTNPYRKVDGVLTQFRLMMGPYLMEFKAHKFDPDKAPKEEMLIPEKAVNVNRDDMVAILNRLMEQNL